MATTVGTCVVLIKRERTWIQALYLELLQNLNSLKFMFIAVLCRDWEIRFLFWGKAGLKCPPVTPRH